MRKVSYRISEDEDLNYIFVKNLEEAKTELLKLRFKYPESFIGISYYQSSRYKRRSKYSFCIRATKENGIQYWRGVNHRGHRWVKDA